MYAWVKFLYKSADLRNDVVESLRFIPFAADFIKSQNENQNPCTF